MSHSSESRMNPRTTRTARVRFVREAEITGRLEHPGIVPVYGLGEFADGRPEYAMRFIEGESLRDGDRQAPRRRRRLGRRPGFAGSGAAESREEVPGCLQRRIVCPQSRDRPSGHQTLEHHARPVWRDAGGRLGTGQADRPARGSGGRAGDNITALAPRVVRDHRRWAPSAPPAT